MTKRCLVLRMRKNDSVLSKAETSFQGACDEERLPSLLYRGRNIFHISVFRTDSRQKKGKGHANYRLSVNPKKGDPSTAYLRKALCEDEKRRFTLMPYANYEIADEDDDYVDGLLKKRKK